MSDASASDAVGATPSARTPMVTRPLLRMVITWAVALAVYLGVGRLEARDVANSLPREDGTLEARADQLAAQVTRVVSRVRDVERARIALLCESLAAEVDLPLSRRALIAVRQSELRNLSVLRRDASGASSVAYAYRAEDVPRGIDTAIDWPDVEDAAPATAPPGRTSGIHDGLASELSSPEGLGMSRLGCRASSGAGVDYLVVADLDLLALSATAIPDSLGEVVMETEASRAPGARRWLGPGSGDAPRPALRVRETVRTLHRTFAWAPVVSALVSALAIFLALRPRRPGVALDTLEAAAERIGRGDLEVTLSPEGGAADGTYTAFNRMTRDLKDARARLVRAERVAAWRDVARRIAHEIKNPLSPIQMSIETLKKVWDRKHPDFEVIFRESTATVLEEVQRMKRIVSEFSDFARMPAPRPAPTDLYDVASQVVSLFKDTAPDVECKVVGVPLVLDVDGDQVRQALINLVKNGLEALTQAKTPTGAETAGEPKRLEVRVEREIDKDGERARIVVTDNGPGMSEITRQKLFTPYFTTKQAGTGLGLAITHRIVQEHGGRIRVDSELGVGTRFIVRLPGRTPGSPGRAQPS